MASAFDALVAIRPRGSLPPLYCVPAVSGSPYSYNGLARQLDPAQPVYGFEAPGFDNDRLPATSLDELAEEFVSALVRHGPGPYRLLGWSMGGVVAFEMALRLASRGVEVPLLCVVDSLTPARLAVPEEPVLIEAFLHDFVAAAGGGIQVSDILDQVRTGTPDEVFAQIEGRQIFPSEIDAAFLGRRYAVFRAHVIVAYGHDSSGVYEGALVSIRAARSDPVAMRWRRFATEVTEHIVDGDHHTIWTGNNLVALGRIVRAELARVDAEGVHQ